MCMLSAKHRTPSCGEDVQRVGHGKSQMPRQTEPSAFWKVVRRLLTSPKALQVTNKAPPERAARAWCGGTACLPRNFFSEPLPSGNCDLILSGLQGFQMRRTVWKCSIHIPNLEIPFKSGVFCGQALLACCHQSPRFEAPPAQRDPRSHLLSPPRFSGTARWPPSLISGNSLLWASWKLLRWSPPLLNEAFALGDWAWLTPHSQDLPCNPCNWLGLPCNWLQLPDLATKNTLVSISDKWQFGI